MYCNPIEWKAAKSIIRWMTCLMKLQKMCRAGSGGKLFKFITEAWLPLLSGWSSWQWRRSPGLPHRRCRTYSEMCCVHRSWFRERFGESRGRRLSWRLLLSFEEPAGINLWLGLSQRDKWHSPCVLTCRGSSRQDGTRRIVLKRVQDILTQQEDPVCAVDFLGSAEPCLRGP